ncbi:Hint domain-containing protein [uncultured Litoreibacter sp.]|uniref:Hint domain-containing protein n=1 Tax=uncultured Litoreibacter sp. TaxID=1392394 RepID=UPI00261CA16A|nr:Hint domain-containing protein [uncultured Litoreibacter sp.]
MGTGFGGTYVLTSDQTRLDGVPATTGQAPQLGQVWSWQGEAVRLDGPQSTFLLGTSLGHDAWRVRVAKAVQRRFEVPDAGTGHDAPLPHDEIPQGFLISDGTSQFTLIPVDAAGTGKTLLWCADGMPAAGRNYNVMRVAPEETVLRRTGEFGGDVICFTAGTRIGTPDGHQLVEHLGVGDMVQTKDNGVQQILWIGARRITGARMYAMPELRPVRLRAGALEVKVPDEDLLVSPHHRMLYSGPNAQDLFNAQEVLISARDMVNDHSIYVDYSVREVTYIHLMFARHQILWANGVPTESFHPANTTLETVEPQQRDALLDVFPDLADDLQSYGGHARRNLAKPEAAILLHERV